MSREEGTNFQICPECGSKLAVRNRSHNGVPVTIAACTGYPDCTYFYWSVPEGRAHPPAPLGDLDRWAVDESLRVLRDEFPSREWQEALASDRGSPGEKGGARRG